MVKKEALFEKYKSNLNMLTREEFLSAGEENLYICPLTLDEHTSLDEEDPLSLEHVPQHKLAGKGSILTNESVNNFCGSNIDNHLIEQFKSLQKHRFLPDKEIHITTELDGEKVNAIFEAKENGEHSLIVNKKNNNPKIHEKFIKNIGKGDVVNIKVRESKKIDIRKAKCALLKNAYLIFFEKTGYAFIFDRCYDCIRSQILNPNSSLIPNKFYLNLPDTMADGVYLIMTKGIESVFVVFDQKYQDLHHKHGVFLPLGKNTLFKIIKNLEMFFKKNKQIPVKLQRIPDDFLTNIEVIKSIAEFVDSIKL